MRILRVAAAPLVFLLALGMVAFFGTTSLTSPGLEIAPVAKPRVEPGTLPARIAENGVLRVGVKFDHPGLSMKNLQGTPEGFEVDMVEYFAAQLGLSKDQIEWIEVSSANREQLLDQGKVDLVVATLTITEKRLKLIDFAGPYLNIAQDLIIPKDNPKGIKSPVEPAGLKVCSTLGGAVSQATRKAYPGVNLIEFDNSAKCIDAIKTGAVDAFATQSPIGAGYVSKDSEYIEMLNNEYGPEEWGIGIKKGANDLCTFINAQLVKFEADGSYKQAWNESVGQYSKAPVKLPKLRKCS